MESTIKSANSFYAIYNHICNTVVTQDHEISFNISDSSSKQSMRRHSIILQEVTQRQIRLLHDCRRVFDARSGCRGPFTDCPILYRYLLTCRTLSLQYQNGLLWILQSSYRLPCSKFHLPLDGDAK